MELIIPLICFVFGLLLIFSVSGVCQIMMEVPQAFTAKDEIKLLAVLIAGLLLTLYGTVKLVLYWI